MTSRPPSRHDGDRTFGIRELCEAFDVTPRALRFYEDRGLLSPARRGATELYSTRDRARLQLILRGKRVGFSLAEIGEMLDLYDDDAPKAERGVAQMSLSLQRFGEQIEQLKLQRQEIDEAIRTLEDARRRLEAELAAVRPDLLPRASDYENVLSAGLDGDGEIRAAG